MQQSRVQSSAGGKVGAFGSPSHTVELHAAALSASSNEQPVDEELLLEGVLGGDWRGGHGDKGCNCAATLTVFRMSY